MNHKWILKLLPVAFMLVLIACGPGKAKQSNQEMMTDNAAELKQGDRGELAYKKHCMVCHQRDAGGIPKMYPPLANNKVISGNKEKLIDIVLNGMSVEIVVNGEKYTGVMASYRNLSDQEIASVLNYLRSNFGNNGEKITPADIKDLR